MEHSGGVAEIIGVQTEGSKVWHIVDNDRELSGKVRVVIDAEHRSRVAQLHTDTHILNALVFDRFDGALVTGAQIYANGTARMDFDLPDADNDVLRGLEADINDIICQGLEVTTEYVSVVEARETRGLIRSAAVAPPPTPDGRIRIVAITGIDRQACGGTHVSNTGESAPIRIKKVENKGRHNRRVRIELT
jgi:misacylated tRNA(Ala) deacylase